MINFSTFTKCKTENDILREKYLNEDIFKIGLKVTNGEKIGEIIRRGPNYVICLDENKNVFRSWITNIKEYVEEKPKKINKYRNYNNIRNNMDSVQSAAIFLGMLPEHSYKIRRAVERTILEGMDYDTAVKTISEDLKSSFLVNKAVEYYDAILSEAANPQMMAQKAKDTAKTIVSQAQAKGTIAAAKIKAKQVQDNAMKAAKKSAQMKEEDDIDEAMINPRTRMATRQKMNPNEIRVQANMGSLLAKKIRQQSGLAEEDPCWKGYTQVGMKTKNGKEVPNCVPEGVVKEAGLYGGVPKMYVKYAAVQKKVRELEEKQKSLAAKYFAEKDPKKKEAMMPALKKGTEELAYRRRNLADIEEKYLNNLYKDVELANNLD